MSIMKINLLQLDGNMARLYTAEFSLAASRVTLVCATLFLLDGEDREYYFASGRQSNAHAGCLESGSVFS